MLGFKSGFLNKNSQVSEALYGYASALNHVQFPDKNSFFIQDISISEKTENHPYQYTHNIDLGLIINRLILALGVSEESSYVYANAFTAIARVASLYLLYFLLLEITGSALFAILTITLIGFDYYNFYNTHYSVLRGNSFVAYILFLFSIIKLSKGGRAGEWFYLFLAVLALWLSFLIGYMTTSTLILTMIFLMLFGVTRIGMDQFAKIILFGVAIPFVLRIITVVWLIGPKLWVYDDWLTKCTKMGTLTKITSCTNDLFYVFGDANFFVGWPSSPITTAYIINVIISYNKSALYYFTRTIDWGTMFLLIIFPLWVIALSLKNRRSDTKDNQFSFTYFFMLTALFVILLNIAVFPSYYYVFEIVYSNYIGLLVLTLPAAYFLSRIITSMVTFPSKINIVICVFILGVFSGAKMYNNYFFYKLFPMEKDTMFEVLKPYAGKSAVANTMNNFIYSKIVNRPVTYEAFLDRINTNPELIKFNPLSIGSSWKVHSRDQFKSYEYNFPDLTIFNFNIYEKFMRYSMMNDKYSINDFFYTKNISQVQQRYRSEIKKDMENILKIYGTDRILYRDNDFVIINNNILKPSDEMVVRRYIWDNLISIQKECFDVIVNLDYKKDNYQLLTSCIQSKIADEPFSKAWNDDLYVKQYNHYINIIRVMDDMSLARKEILNYFINSNEMKMPAYYEGNMPIGHMIIISLITYYNHDDVPSFNATFEGYYGYLPLHIRKYALAMKVLMMEREPNRDIFKYKFYKDSYRKILQNSL